jgi:hypothetical protein
MIEQMQNFYRFLFNLNFYDFCKILEKPTNDAWAVEKFSLMTRDFGRFLCDCGSVAGKLYLYMDDYSNGCATEGNILDLIN